MKNRRWIIGGLAVALLGTCALMVAIGALTLREFAGGDFRFRFGDFRLNTELAESTEEQRFSVNEPAMLIVENDTGEVIVTAGDTDEIVVSIHKIGYAATQAEAEAERDAIQVLLTQQGDTVRVVYQRPSEVVLVGDARGEQVDFTITVPVSTVVNVTSGAGRVALMGTTGVADLHSDFGDITVLDLTGKLIAATNSGTITARRIRAGEADIELRSDFGTVTLEDATAKAVSLRSSSGKLELTDVTAAGKVVADTDFGSISLRGVSGDAYDLKTNSGEITVVGASGPLKAHTDFGQITITEALTVTLDLKSNSGNIDFSGSLGKGPHSARTDFGRVTLALPKDTAATVDLSTDFGKINTQFPITVSGDLKEQDATRFTGPLNGGGEELTIHTNSGNITLEILNP
ncbi:MAG: DUF4097 family beta strand repeat-containing protein [Anaerolineales bacterium]